MDTDACWSRNHTWRITGLRKELGVGEIEGTGSGVMKSQVKLRLELGCMLHLAHLFTYYLPVSLYITRIGEAFSESRG